MENNKGREVTLQLRKTWNEVVDRLTLRQLHECMGGDMSYKSKAQRAMKSSKSKAVHQLCNQMLELYSSHFEGR
jgi:hypothetical protein